MSDQNIQIDIKNKKFSDAVNFCLDLLKKKKVYFADCSNTLSRESAILGHEMFELLQEMRNNLETQENQEIIPLESAKIEKTFNYEEEEKITVPNSVNFDYSRAESAEPEEDDEYDTNGPCINNNSDVESTQITLDYKEETKSNSPDNGQKIKILKMTIKNPNWTPETLGSENSELILSSHQVFKFADFATLEQFILEKIKINCRIQKKSVEIEDQDSRTL